ncbi:MAG: hypothetical protein Q9191_003699 [Dirinaria sp. TL-2023a]
MLVFCCILNQLVAAAAIQTSNATQLKAPADGCSDSPDWLGLKLVKDDCVGTVNKLYNIEVLEHGRKRYEFLGIGAEAEFKLPKMKTPRRYTVGACTLVLAMMDIFKPGELPNQPKGPFYETDIATYSDLHFAALNVELHCVVLRHGGGYGAVGRFPRDRFGDRELFLSTGFVEIKADTRSGEYGSIGVMIMSTESYENRLIPPGISPALTSTFGLPNVLNINESTVIRLDS